LSGVLVNGQTAAGDGDLEAERVETGGLGARGARQRQAESG